MLRQEYCENDDVQQLILWLTDVVSGETNINYPHPDGVWGVFGGAVESYTWPNNLNNGPQPGTRPWEFPERSLFTLAANSDLAANEEVLNRLKGGLRDSLYCDDEEIAPWLNSIFLWGGVARQANLNWLNNNRYQLREILHATIDVIMADDDDFNLNIPRFNSGMTKVYSLLVDDFIIYDSRVAGALAYLVSIWGAEFDIPELLRFRCMDAMGNQCRNPNRNDFPRMYANPNLYLKWNLRANWILQAVSQQMGHGGLSLREIEAGLFMMGYDLPNNDDNLNAD